MATALPFRHDDPHPVIRAIFVVSQLETFIHVLSGGRAASIIARREAVSSRKNDGVLGFRTVPKPPISTAGESCRERLARDAKNVTATRSQWPEQPASRSSRTI